MALEKYVSERRLAYFKGKLDNEGYKNKIEKIKVNGNEQTIDETDKSVNIPIPVTYNGSYSGATTGFRIYGMTHNTSGSDAQTEFYGTSSNEDYIELTHREVEPISGGVVDLFERQIATTAYVDKTAPLLETEETTIGDGYNLAAIKRNTTNDKSGVVIKKPDADTAVIDWFGKDGTSENSVTLPTKDYVDNNAGKIDKIKVNGTEQTITNKEVDLKVAEIYSEQMGDTGKADSIEISTKSCGFHINKDLTVTLLGANGSLDHQFSLVDRSYVDTTFRTEAQVAQQIAEAQTGAFVKVDSYSDLPAEGQAGKIYLVPNSGSGQNVYDEYIWCVVAMVPGGGGESPVYGYEKIGTTAVDLTGYVQESDLVEITEAEIDAMFA